MKLLIVDDDVVLKERLCKTLGKKGFEVESALGVETALTLLKEVSFTHALVDLKLSDGFGLHLVERIKTLQPEVRIVVLTGYGNIATAVAAIKHGAVDYLAKPCDGQTIFEVLIGHKEEDPIENLEVMSVDRIKWEHIQRVLLENSHNISQTARALHMHRRTLQRILSKHAPRI